MRVSGACVRLLLVCAQGTHTTLYPPRFCRRSDVGLGLHCAHPRHCAAERVASVPPLQTRLPRPNKTAYMCNTVLRYVLMHVAARALSTASFNKVVRFARFYVIVARGCVRLNVSGDVAVRALGTAAFTQTRGVNKHNLAQQAMQQQCFDHMV